MKTIAIAAIMFTAMLLTCLTDGFAQRVVKGINHNKRHEKVVVVKKGHHHHGRVAIYHPRWAPRATYAHRWGFFPRKNFYWDNIRAVYVYKVNTVWVTNVEAPASVSKIDLENEKHVELVDMDESDSVQVSNDEHLKAYSDK